MLLSPPGLSLVLVLSAVFVGVSPRCITILIIVITIIIIVIIIIIFYYHYGLYIFNYLYNTFMRTKETTPEISNLFSLHASPILSFPQSLSCRYNIVIKQNIAYKTISNPEIFVCEINRD